LLNRVQQQLGTRNIGKHIRNMKSGKDTGLTALSCSRYHVHEGTSAFSRHLVNSKRLKVRSMKMNTLTSQLTLGLSFAVDTTSLLLLDRDSSRSLLSGGSLASTTEEHARDTMANS
jgi:hypothetical protein